MHNTHRRNRWEMARTQRSIRDLGVRLTLGTGVAVALFAIAGGNSGYLAASSVPGAGATSRVGIAGHQVRLVDDTDPAPDSCGDPSDSTCTGGGGTGSGTGGDTGSGGSGLPA